MNFFLTFLAYFVGGVVAGALYFTSLWWSTRRFAQGGRMIATVALMIGRFLLLGGVLVLASLQGALPLLLMTLGIFLARFVVTRRVRAVAA